jgi:hypothetical protein
MTLRALRNDDIVTLKYMESGFPYCDPQDPMIEKIMVVVDDNDVPVMACAAERILQLYLWCGTLSPLSKMHALRLLHEGMEPELKAKGYSEVNAFIPPAIALKFGKRLAKSFNWKPNWPSWARGI